MPRRLSPSLFFIMMGMITFTACHAGYGFVEDIFPLLDQYADPHIHDPGTEHLFFGDTPATAYAGLVNADSFGSQYTRIKPNNAAHSYLFLKITNQLDTCGSMMCTGGPMPPAGQLQLSAEQIGIIHDWIMQGAPFHRPPRDCTTSPCQHGGACTGVPNPPEGGDAFTCHCTPGYTGPECDTELNACTSHPCAQGSTCKRKDADFECVCPIGVAGRVCDTVVDACESSPCQHGGSCGSERGVFTCTCLGDWEGERCAHRPSAYSRMQPMVFFVVAIVVVSSLACGVVSLRHYWLLQSPQGAGFQPVSSNAVATAFESDSDDDWMQDDGLHGEAVPSFTVGEEEPPASGIAPPAGL